MIKTEAREYQKAIVETAKRANTLVVLPTGIGKTLIALLVIVHRLNEYRPSKALVLAPTRPLVEQHMQTFKENLPELYGELNLFTGEVPAPQRTKIWRESDIVFSTPQCIANDLKKERYSLEDVSIIIIDEAHRCLKNYDYTTVVKYYKNQAQNQRIVGLTASPGTDYAVVKQICDHLAIEEVEARSRESEDVKAYLHERAFERINVTFPPEFVEISMLLKTLYDDPVNELKSRNLLFGPANKITLLKLQARLAQQANAGHGAAMYGMSLTAQAIKIAHALELLETQTLSGLKKYLDELIKQAEEKKSKGVQRLIAQPRFKAAMISLKNLLNERKEHPKIERAKTIIKEELEKNVKAKILIFTQFRETAHVLVQRLKEIKECTPSVFIGQAKKETGGMSQREQKETIEKFRTGEINVLCATSIGEEGLDIPEVNAVLFYEPIPSAIRKIQREGRTARHSAGKLIILVTEDTKDEISHYASTAREKKMYKTIDAIKETLSKKSTNLTRYL